MGESWRPKVVSCRFSERLWSKIKRKKEKKKKQRNK